MTPSQRALLAASVAAALIGFAAGWFARVWTEPTVESRAHDAAETLRGKLHELSR
ncbi:DUF1049 domain-containing protein [Anaeromyxobacter oryzae]|uniref:Uncharacterized protein n=1 Tax=Anaeromyxobacter oryzae TaxID=2918170 RepID=A0ABN6MMH3_9BACT|nr:DUF1049 domain-containing protein [Anaeromyxobacter oryzae]BDG02156.1 hypothetical protein AMOR_11520 [Anaeromyxobacter oryzae]